MKIPASPLQRWALYQLTYAEAQRNQHGQVVQAGQQYKGQEARRFRRFCKHLGLTVIAETVIRHTNVSVKQLKDESPRLFEVDAADLERLGELDEKTERNGIQNEILGPLFDDAAELRAERPIGFLDAPEYDPKAEDWKPPTEATNANPVPSDVR